MSPNINSLFLFSERLLAAQNPLSHADRPHQLFADAPPTAGGPLPMPTHIVAPPPSMPPPGLPPPPSIPMSSATIVTSTGVNLPPPPPLPPSSLPPPPPLPVRPPAPPPPTSFPSAPPHPPASKYNRRGSLQDFFLISEILSNVFPDFSILKNYFSVTVTRNLHKFRK